MPPTIILNYIPIILFIFVSIYTCIALDEPNIIELFDEDRIHLTIDFCPITINSPTNPATTFVSFTGRCHCQYDPITETSFGCSSPGPTFLFHPGTTVHMTWHNIFAGSPSNPAFDNSYRDISVFNMHSHGFHIEPDQDDVTLHINPGTTYTYTYTIPADHYPGFHHLHPHHHGSTSWYIHSGAFSAAIIEYDDARAAIEYDANLLNMRQNILVASFIYGVDRSACNCNNGFQQFVESVTQREQIESYCFEYCSFPAVQRDAETNYEYDMTSDDATQFKLYLINGQFQPVVDDMVANRWRRIRLLNIMNQLVMQIRLPLNRCQWFLLAIDGIYLRQNSPRDLSGLPYNGEYVIPPAGRAEFAVNCDAGSYAVISSTANVDGELSNMPRMEANILLFSLEVNAANSAFRDLEGNGIVVLPNSFPNKPFYLRDLIGTPANQIQDCECASFNGECEVEMRAQNLHTINGLEWDADTPMQLLQKDAIYDFDLVLNGHVYHQHIYPFQLVNTVSSGLLGIAGDYMDTISANNNFEIRTGLYDFAGKMMVHCHNLPHEDEGMMTFYQVMNQLNTQTCRDLDPKIPTLQPTFSPIGIQDIETENPTDEPTPSPTNSPTNAPSSAPTNSPTNEPTNVPTNNPTNNPSAAPTNSPTNEPTPSPSSAPTESPTQDPTDDPTTNPTPSPTDITVENIIDNGNNAAVTEPIIPEFITDNPTTSPTDIPTKNPTDVPTTSNPTTDPTNIPTRLPTINPTKPPTSDPTNNPTTNPTTNPTRLPTINPTRNPTNAPTLDPIEAVTTGNPTTAGPTAATVIDNTCCDCTTKDSSSGCAADPICESIICERINRRCCNRRWNRECADEAASICQAVVLPTCCDCLNKSDDTGCSADIICETSICASDPFCCGNSWDSICVHQATAVCNGEDIPQCCGCTLINTNPGCAVDSECQNLICSADPFCCGLDPVDGGSWDSNCVELATNVCSGESIS